MILFSADWHIKLGQKNVPVAWARKRYYSFFEQIRDIVEESHITLHIIGGDIFDRVPTLDELQLYFDFVASCNVKTLIYDGNHEATRKGKSFLNTLAEVTSRINSLVTIVTSTTEFLHGNHGKFTIFPYCELHKKNSIEEIDSSVPIFTHVRGEIPPHVTPEVDLERFSKFPIVLAGDLHSHDNCQQNIVYPGSPMTTSFHRSRVNTGMIIILPDWDWYWERLELPQLLRYTIKDEKDIKAGDYDHIIYELEGDLTELASVQSNELLDKKVVKRNSETSLILDKEMTIGEELVEYLTYILEIPEERITSILGTFNDNIKNIKVG